MNKAITINTTDNLGVALTHLNKGEQVVVNSATIMLKENIQAKHKFALKDFALGDEMYGLVVGTAKEIIKKGKAITVKNTAHKASAYTTKHKKKFEWTAPDVSRFKGRTFNGYLRKDGQVGTANYWLVFPLVFCENRNITILKTAFEKALGYEKANAYEQLAKDLVARHKSGDPLDEVRLNRKENKEQKHYFNNVKIKFITHQGGCGGTREDSDTLCRLLAGYLKKT